MPPLKEFLEYRVLVYLHNACITIATNIKSHMTDTLVLSYEHVTYVSGNYNCQKILLHILDGVLIHAILVKRTRQAVLQFKWLQLLQHVICNLSFVGRTQAEVKIKE
jgi:hypothetical protein